MPRGAFFKTFSFWLLAPAFDTDTWRGIFWRKSAKNLKYLTKVIMNINIEHMKLTAWPNRTIWTAIFWWSCSILKPPWKVCFIIVMVVRVLLHCNEKKNNCFLYFCHPPLHANMLWNSNLSSRFGQLSFAKEKNQRHEKYIYVTRFPFKGPISTLKFFDYLFSTFLCDYLQMANA